MSSDRILDELAVRGLLDTCTNLDTLRSRLLKGPIRAYVGYDPTADSLHVGHLVAIAMQRLFMLHGHPQIAVVGGFTGPIGDPSGKSQERNLLDTETAERNRVALTGQLTRLLSVDGATPTIVDNKDWFDGMTAFALLRDIGKLMPIKDMLERDSVKRRMDAGGMSFTEFSYQALQAYDFTYLREAMNCELQLGGTDQYGNITAGTDMIRRRGLGRAWGLVWPLLTKSDGSKFGKTAGGAVWLSAERTSPFAFHQYWLTTADDNVRELLLKLTLLPVSEVDAVMARHEADRRARIAQRVLADDVTTWVHGPEALDLVLAAAQALFTGTMDRQGAEQVAGTIPTLVVEREDVESLSWEHLAHRVGLCASLSEAQRLIRHGGLYAAGERVASVGTPPEIAGEYVVLRRGPRAHALVKIGE